VGNDSKNYPVIMIHRALLGSLERFMGVLVEHYGGAFPLWLAPVQVMVIPVSEKVHSYANQVVDRLKAHPAGLRVETDLRNEKLGYKIRAAQMQKLPYMLVVGEREAEGEMVAVRSRSEGEQGTMSVEGFADMVQDLTKKKGAILQSDLRE
jgi:threonyl-tRNA synthetase